MKKRILAICLVVALAAIAVAGGTMAYLTDTDAKVNTMTVGNVDITQNEWQRPVDPETNQYTVGKMIPFVDNRKLLPAVYVGTLAYDSEIALPSGYTVNYWNTTVNNEVDKFIDVTNFGTEAAYIRTIVLMENTADNAICAKIHGLWNNSDGQYRKWLTNPDGTDVIVEINGVNYSIAVCTYKTALAPGATSAPSLMQVFLDPSATNEWSALLGTDQKFNILALTQACQAAGFENAEQALNAGFGEVTAEKVAEWFKDVK